MTDVQGGEAAEVVTNWWDASIHIQNSRGEHGEMLFNALVRTRGASKELAIEAAAIVSELLTRGRKGFWRYEPYGASEKSFETGEVQHHGFARFSFLDEAGGMQRIPDEDEGFLGLAKVSAA